MAATSAFDQWATATLNQIGAPVNSTNLATLQKWATKESGGSPMRWNNPLNTTQPDTGSVSAGATQASVQRYPTPAIGAHATAVTLTNGRYPGILAALRQSVPTASWLSFDPKITQQLGTWGSGTNWLGGPTPPTTNFLASSPGGSSTSKSDPCAGLTGFAAAWCQITQFPANVAATSVNPIGVIFAKVMYIGSGILLVGGGMTLLVIIVLKGSGATAAIGGVAGAVTPQGRALKAVGAASKTSASVKSTNAEITANRSSLAKRKRTSTRKGI